VEHRVGKTPAQKPKTIIWAFSALAMAAVDKEAVRAGLSLLWRTSAWLWENMASTSSAASSIDELSTEDGNAASMAYQNHASQALIGLSALDLSQDWDISPD
jgi:hypothetical protein